MCTLIPFKPRKEQLFYEEYKNPSITITKGTEVTYMKVFHFLGGQSALCGAIF